MDYSFFFVIYKVEEISMNVVVRYKRLNSEFVIDKLIIRVEILLGYLFFFIDDIIFMIFGNG